MTRITIACLDMAGTTVRDDGSVLEAFGAALATRNLPAATFSQAMRDVKSSMGQSKIEVFRRVLGDEQAAQQANEAFEDHYAVAVRAGHVAAMPGATDVFKTCRDAGIRVCLATGFSPATRDAIISELGWGDLIDLALSPADAGRGRPWPDLPLTALLFLHGGAVSELAVVGDTASDVESGLRAGAGVVAGVLSGADSRANLEQAGAPLILDTIAGLPPYVIGLAAARGETITRCGGNVTATDVPGASPAASALGWSIFTATSPDSRTPTRVTEPRKVFVVTIPLPFSATCNLNPSGRTSRSTGLSPSSSLRLSSIGTVAPRAATAPPPVNSPGIRFMTPTNSATNAVAGRSYSSAGTAICSNLPYASPPPGRPSTGLPPGRG
jgi:phosphoglycolate phosphatase